jgi:glycolate oxidase
VLPSGKILQLGGKTVKRSTGYELMHLIIGSEGTLAVVSKIIIKLIKLPRNFITLYIPFNTLDDAIRSVSDILKNRLTPAALEFLERDVILETEKQTGKRMPHDTAEAYVIARLCDDDESVLYTEGEEISKICLRNGSLDVLVADTDESQRKIWDVRSMVYDGIIKGRDVQIVDTAVPIGDIAKYMKVVKNISTKYGIRILSLGHAGDGNIHIHPIKGQKSNEEWSQIHPRIMEEIYKASVSFGGTISGEHGIGYAKKKYFTSYFDNEQIKLMKGIKKVFDPTNILNPGKILDEEQ